MSDLASRSCVPCKGGVPPLKGDELKKIARQLPSWKVIDEHHISRTYDFPDFKNALNFVNKIGAKIDELPR